MVSLSIDPPPSSRRHRERRGGGGLRLAVVTVVLAVTFAAGVFAGRLTAPGGAFPIGAHAPATAAASPATGAEPATATSAPAAGAAAQPSAPAPVAEAPAVPGATTSAPAASAAPAPAAADGRRRLAVDLAGPLEASIAAALGPAERALAEQLTAVVNRLLVWDLHVARDGRKGDRLEVLWSPPKAAAPGMAASGEPVVDAVRYASTKLGSVLAVYRFQPEGDRWPRYWRADGTLLEPKLVDGPIADYEQVTSLLKDGRRHKGVDFKTPVGSPVMAPFDGAIERRNWNFAGNGNCLDVLDAASGRHAIFLHLDVLPKEMAVGRRVRKGEVIASSGNSGHSFAPHLHYQLEDGSGKVLDPYDVHRIEKRALPAGQRGAFEAAKASLDAALKG
jgi:murein DD-endopeptidase